MAKQVSLVIQVHPFEERSEVEVDVIAIWADKVASDWWDYEMGNIGLLETLGLKDWDDLQPGFWFIEGHLWSDQDYYGEWDGGFEIETAEPVRDILPLLKKVCPDDPDLLCVMGIYGQLTCASTEDGKAIGRDRLRTLMNTLLFMETCMEEES